MKRRNFIKKASIASASCFIPFSGFGMSKSMSSMINSLRVKSSDKKLILLRLNGGNDGLNTIIPLDSYSNLEKHRKDIILPFPSLHKLDSERIGLHPKMKDIHNLFQDGNIAFAHNVSIENSSRSHFKATRDIILPTNDRGWLVDYLKTNQDAGIYTDPPAIAVGSSVSMTCNGYGKNYSYPTDFSPKEFDTITGGLNSFNGSYSSDLLQHIANTATETNQYQKRITEVLDAGYANSALYDLDDPISRAFYDIARAITGGIQTSVFIINISGFDTHGNQVNQNDSTIGDHANKWTLINNAVSSFVQDMKSQFIPEAGSYLDNILGMTFSEFGRRIAQNGSFGTDHGNAGPVMFFGNCFNKQIIGSPPVIPDKVELRDAVPMEIDVRDLYASVLRYHFGSSELEIESQFSATGKEIIYYESLFCSKSQLNTPTEVLDIGKLKLYPNPSTTRVNISGRFDIGEIKISLFDAQGKLIFSRSEENNNSNIDYKTFINVSNLHFGVYFLKIQSHNLKINQTMKIVKN